MESTGTSVSSISDTLGSHGPQHARSPSPSPTPRTYSNASSLSLCCHPAISSSVVPFFSHLPSFNLSSIKVFSNESILLMRWPKYWSFSFSISPSNEHPGLISFRMDWLDLPCSPRDSQESSETPQFKSINSSVLRFLHSPNSHIHT